MHAARLALPAVCFALALAAPARADVTLPTGTTVKAVDFERHVMGLFGRMGCASGSCHGSFQGKGGFRLSLFGYEPEKDYYSLSRELRGRRIDLTNPDNSLVLLKATAQVEHGGSKRIGKDSWQYQLLRDWIAQGAKWSRGSGEIKKVTVSPSEVAFEKAGRVAQVRILITFADGSEEDVTPLCDFRVNDDAVAEVSNLGVVKSLRAGDTAIIVSYRGQVLPVRVLVPVEQAAGYQYPKVPEVNYVDREVFAKLRRLNIVPSDLAGDAEFLRRVTIDTIASLPSAQEVTEFLADKRSDKRERKIDELLGHPRHAALWATKFCDITGNNTDALENPQPLKAKRSQMWHDWFRKRVADNVPYDEIVKGVLTATSRDNLKPDEYVELSKKLDDQASKGFKSDYADKPSLDLFWRRQQQVTVDQWGEKTAAAFLGVRLECAQCHKHPFDRWTQADYRAYANIFAQVNVGISPESKKAIDAENARRREANTGKNNNQIAQVREAFLGQLRPKLPHPDTNQPLPPKALGGPAIRHEAGKDSRVTLYEWMHAPDNAFFARSFANRVWGHYLGRGVVDPVDDFSLANPASNDKLLNALAQDFVKNKYDLRKLERTILLSRTYQLTSTTNATNKFDNVNYSHSYVRGMMAEVVVDLINDAFGITERFGNEAPEGCRAIEVGASRLNDQKIAYVFRIFGRPPRTTACDCERALEPALPQKLYLMADQAIVDKLRNGTRVPKLLAAHKDESAALDELFLSTLTRLPTERERQAFEEHRASAKDRATAFNDVLWALINTREFIFNH